VLFDRRLIWSKDQGDGNFKVIPQKEKTFPSQRPERMAFLLSGDGFFKAK